MNGRRWVITVGSAAYCAAVLSIYLIVSGSCWNTGSAGLAPLCAGAEVFCVLAWPILAFIAGRLWISKWKTETSGENGSRFGRFVIVVFAVVAACIVWVGQLAIGSRLYPFTITARISFDLFLVEVAVTVLAGLIVGFWTK